MTDNPPRRSYPETLEIVPLDKPARATIRVPGSKSITNRALILAALSDPEKGSELQGACQSEDTEIMIAALRDLSFSVRADWASSHIHVRRGPHARIIPATQAELFLGNSGTSMRFLTALVALGHGRYRLDGVARMRERPIEDLLAALRQLGVKAYSERHNGYPPVIVETSGLEGGPVRLKANLSSQFLSGLLMVAPLARQEVTIEIEGPLVSRPYVEMTLEMMEEFGVEIDLSVAGAPYRLQETMKDFGVRIPTNLGSQFQVPNVPWYAARSFNIESDASAASYFFATAAITHGHVIVPGLGNLSIQGDVDFVDILQQMGCQVVLAEDEAYVRGGALCGVDVDMNAISDCVMTLAAVACFAEGPTTIRNVAHIRHKETDRLHALATELQKVGAKVDEFPDGLRITPEPLHGAEIETYNDHRIAMSMTLIGLKVPGIVIRNPGCVAKTYPGFFEDLEKLREK
jgi:3-phosphoshikimate 1-carboxyvinyltransferase